MFYHSILVAFLYAYGALSHSIDQISLMESEDGLNDCDVVCTLMSQIYGEEVFQTGLSPSFTSSFFAQQQRETIPACVIQPSSSHQVSEALQILSRHNCHFAIKSGGHGMFARASNAIGGVTIDLQNFNSLSISEDYSSTWIGSGKRWGEVYEVLEPMNLTVVGGRDTQLGVGGFILGGGISFTSRQYGWGCDNVRSYEVVLSDASVMNVSHETHPDLYFALRGGGNQFGVVTRFELDTYAQGPIWGGHSFYLLDDIPARKLNLHIQNKFSWTIGSLFQKLSHWTVRLACQLGYCSSINALLTEFTAFTQSTDPLAQIILTFVFVPYNINTWVACLNRVYGAPDPDPAVFQGFAAQDRRSIHSTNRITTLSGINAEVDGMNIPGFRQSWCTATFQISLPFMSALIDIFITEIEAISSIPGLIPSLILQIITREEILAFQRKGGNAFGIAADEGPLLLINSAVQWNRPQDDPAIHTTNARITKRAQQLAHEMGIAHRFLYRNYAGQAQDVFAGYSEANRERLKSVRRKYDVGNLFGRLQRGFGL